MRHKDSDILGGGIARAIRTGDGDRVEATTTSTSPRGGRVAGSEDQPRESLEFEFRVPSWMELDSKRFREVREAYSLHYFEVNRKS